MKPLFRDITLQEKFDQDGFLVLPMLSPQEIQVLSKLYEEVNPGELKRIYSNVYNRRDQKQNRHVGKVITDLFKPHIDQICMNHRIAGGSFLVKGVGSESASQLHQDFNNIDEREGISLSFWVPLENVNEHNGCLQVIPSSHKFFTTVRCLTKPSLFLEFDDELEPCLQPVPMKTGEVCIYAHNLFHGSKPNNSDHNRVAVVCSVFPEDSRNIHYYQESGDGKPIEIYETDDNFYYDNFPELIEGKRPQWYRNLGPIDFEPESLDRKAFFRKYRQEKGIPENTSVVIETLSEPKKMELFRWVTKNIQALIRLTQ
ncbi:hypothetical protein GM3708_2228 [Geminocystis sp. NIES-3708]|uniref:phytanoyl-CoA dioxygenase family protein n=1 Tax=Geminocystis sp. NIES-3708 TaxID=1615909 RepID=UPI0005FC8DDB|nr:phytanoyl-CoA dioxygenase family protein [Geminocystis sp. NIES-3708]BAQ61822.1 hypothetical protein GM3708_2228 [Geminocystis sp. NIES-3708]